MTLKKCRDCGTIDPSNPYRVLCPRGLGLQSRHAECLLRIPTIAWIQELKRRIETRTLTKDTYELAVKVLKEWAAIEKKMEKINT